MMYATVADVEKRIGRTLSETEHETCESLLEEVALEIDSYNAKASEDAKKTVSIRVVTRIMGNGDSYGVPIGATQGSMSGLGYGQSFTISNGASGESYLSKMDRKLLGVGNSIGSYSPVQELVSSEVCS